MLPKIKLHDENLSETMEDSQGRLIKIQEQKLETLAQEKRELLASCKDQHLLIDLLWARMIILDNEFRPSQTEGFNVVKIANDLIKRLNPKENSDAHP